MTEPIIKLESLTKRFGNFTENLSNRYDAYEILEVYGAQLAKENGYDSLRQIDLQSPSLSEVVLLKNSTLQDSTKQDSFFNRNNQKALAERQALPETLS